MNRQEPVRIQAGDVTLSGDLVAPPGARGIVLFAHGSGSSRLSPRMPGQIELREDNRLELRRSRPSSGLDRPA